MKSSNANYITKITELMSSVSVFVLVILGSLVLYANNFLIKKRKKELEIYMTLGMGKRKISRILVTDTSIVGVVSLIAGLILGMGASQVLFKNPFIYLSSFLLSAASLVFSYVTILKIGIDTRNPMYIPSLILSIVGTVLFFFSLSGVILYIVNNNKKVYFKGLNIFVVKQIYSKVNTNFLSMSLICLMLFITILILATGISLKKNYEVGLEKITPFDASLIVYGNDKNREDALNKINFKISKNEKYAIYNEYEAVVELKDLFRTEDNILKHYGASFVKISDYNKMLKLKGEKEINLNKDEVLITSNYNKLIKPINEKLKNSNKVNIKGKEYIVKMKRDQQHQYCLLEYI